MEAPSIAPAATAAPSVAIQQLRQKKLDRLISLATKAYQCLEKRCMQALHCRPQRADIVEMLGGEDSEKYIKDSQHVYLCTDNIVQAGLVSQFNQIVIGGGRIPFIETVQSDSNSNIAAFRHWLVEEMREMPVSCHQAMLIFLD